MHMNKNCLLVLILLLPLISFSQTIISGTVIDQVSKKPLSFASIAVQNSTTGTMSNDVGDFELRLKEGQTEIQISYIGYIDATITVDPEKDNYKITLKPYEYKLAEVIVRPMTPLEYIKEALKKYPSLIPSEAFETRAFFAAKTSIANNDNGAYKLEEAVFKTYNTDFVNDTLQEPSQLLLYRLDTKKGFTSIMEQNWRFRKMAKKAKEEKEKEDAEKTDAEKQEEEENDEGVTINVNDLASSGPEVTIEEAKSITKLDFFNSEYFKKFAYTFGEQTYYQGRELIKIDFTNKRKVEGTFFNGSIYLDFNDLAIVAVDYNERFKVPFYANALLKTIIGITINSVDRDVRIRNQKIQDKWYPKEVIFDLELTIKQKKLYEDLSIAQILNIEEVVIDTPSPIAEEHVFDNEVDPKDQIYPLEGVTWDGVNVIKFDD